MKNLFLIILAVSVFISCKKEEELVNYNSLLKSGLVAYFPFNGNANDVSVNQIKGVVTGATLTTGHLGTSNSAYFFSSQNCSPRIEATLNTSSIKTSLSISIWVKQAGPGCIAPRILDFASSPINGPASFNGGLVTKIYGV